MLATIQRVILAAFATTLGQTLTLIFPLLAFGWLIHLCANQLEKNAVRLLGLKAYLYVLGWPGTMVHELGHALFCPLFGHRITRMQLFSFSESRQSTGFVNHTYNSRNPYHLAGNFFISAGPIILGSVIIFMLLRYVAGLPLYWSEMVENGRSFHAGLGLGELLSFFWGFLSSMAGRLYGSVSWTAWQTWVTAYLVLSIGSGMTLSRQDMSTAASGLGIILLLLLLVNLVLASLGMAAPESAALIPWAAACWLILLLILGLCCIALTIFQLLLLLSGK